MVNNLIIEEKYKNIIKYHKSKIEKIVDLLIDVGDPIVIDIGIKCLNALYSISDNTPIIENSYKFRKNLVFQNMIDFNIDCGYYGNLLLFHYRSEFILSEKI